MCSSVWNAICLSLLLLPAGLADAAETDSTCAEGVCWSGMRVIYAGSSLADLLQASSSVKVSGSRWGEVGWDSQYAHWLSERYAGLVTDRMHVRGGRAGELAWRLDGLDIADPVTRAPMGRLPLAFLEKADLCLAGLPAEQGRALSGVVRDDGGFVRDGTAQWARSEARAERTAAGLRMTWPLGETHLFRAGGDMRMISAESFGVRVDTVGATIDRWSAEPLEGSAYLADSILLGDLKLDAGVRLDLFDPALDELEDGSTYPVPDADGDTKYALSPRLGALHRLSDRDAIRIAYGQYSQMPRLDMLYSAGSVPARVDDPDYPVPPQSLAVQGNPGLGFQRTVQYEVGYTRSLDGLTTADAAVYHRETSDLVGTRAVTASGDTLPDYFVYDNSATAAATGLELALFRAPSESCWLHGSATWSWSLAEGTSSGPLLGYRETLEGTQPAGEEHPLDWDQRHTLGLELGARAPEHVSSPVLSGLGATVRWSYGSGYPYTYNAPEAAEQEINGWRYPETMRTDLRLEKRFRAGPLRMTGWMGWRNLFDRRNIDFIASVPWYQVGVGSHFDADPTGPMNNGYAYSQPRRLALGLDIGW